MKITIQNECGAQEFEMRPPMAETLLCMAKMFADLSTEQPAAADPGKVTVTVRPRARSRVESLFGSRENWPVVPAGESGMDDSQQEGLKGFLLMKCAVCGKIKGFCAKRPITAYHCDCGNDTPLEKVRPVFVSCDKCGKSFRYLTNIEDPYIAYNCFSCGAPVDLELSLSGRVHIWFGGRGYV